MNYLFDTTGAIDHLVTRLTVLACVLTLGLAPVVTLALSRIGRLSDHTRADIWARYRTWLWLAPAMLAPILLCPAAAVVLVLVMSLLCYREYARATGLFRERALSALVVAGMTAVAFASLDHWYGLFVALNPLVIVLIAGGSVFPDSPKGYIQRVALAAVGFLLFGAGLGHLGYIANAPNYRPILCMLILCAQLSDVFAYVCGKAFGHRKVFPNTSPNKTLGGHLGALLIITPLGAWLGHLVAEGTPLDHPVRLIGLGLIVAVGAQLGDLVLGSIKRDLGIKDMGATLPGHGGFLDRFNSLLLVAPAAFHYVGFFMGYGLERPVRIITGQP